MNLERVVISGGGTGGHIFPAIAIADEIKRRFPEVKILFVGAEGKMEMEKVPAAGYEIIGLKIVGFQRKLTLSNLVLPFKLMSSLLQARKTLKRFNPQVAIGVGGYASGPTLQMANLLGIPTVLQEQNSFPGKTNKLLAKRAKRICTAYDGLDKYFPEEVIRLTGNPVRKAMVDIVDKRNEAFDFYGFDPAKKTILVIGGSLGARTLNESIVKNYNTLVGASVQVLWQCGKLYDENLKQTLKEEVPQIKRVKFIERMDLAYAMADVIISRAGAISVSELCLVGKPIILVPSPNVAEDHQTKNAMALVEKHAARLVSDAKATELLIQEALNLIHDETTCASLGKAIRELGKPNATEDIVNEIQSVLS
jgi:UDP-N-acetylglucosamine--N-acetylmuramyl-(pentapeptide) pyrophosphoryl-undecaprenol N-acetylglucosamine transferase